MAELFCHGSQAVVAGALEHAFALGARPAEAGEFTRRAFLAGRLDLTEAEAVADLIDSKTVRAAQNAAAQLAGGVGSRVREMRQEILALLAHFYAVCDYTDEDLDPFACAEAASALRQLAGDARQMHAGFLRGRVLQEGLPCVLLGRPNSGKSSLLNALAGQERAIVTDEEGTTRDVIEQVIRCGDLTVRLMDTAGLRQAQGKAEAMGIEKTRQAAQDAQAALCVIDISRQPSTEDEEALALAKTVRPCALILNKSDLPAATQVETHGFDAVFTLSCKTGDGVDALADWLASLAPVDDGAVLVTSARQAALLAAAAEDLLAAADSAESGMTADAFLSDAERAAHTLGQITGETADPDIAGEIFRRFCVGK